MGDVDDEFGDFDDGDFLAAEKTGQKRSFDEVDHESSSPAKRMKDESPSLTYTIPRDILFETWGFPEFRLKQGQAISRLLTGKSAVVVFPTGGGKSLVYQVPALAFDRYDEESGRPRGGGVTLVVSPLIALMKVGGGAGSPTVMLTYTGSSRCLEETRRISSSNGLIPIPRVMAGHLRQATQWDPQVTVSSAENDVQSAKQLAE